MWDIRSGCHGNTQSCKFRTITKGSETCVWVFVMLQNNYHSCYRPGCCKLQNIWKGGYNVWYLKNYCGSVFSIQPLTNIGQTPLNTRKCKNFLATGFPQWLLGFYHHFVMYKKCHTCREACSESGELGHIVWQASAAEWWRKSVGREVFPFAQASNEDIWRNRSQLEFVPFVSWRRTARQDGAETCTFYNRFLLCCKLPQLIRDTRGLRVAAEEASLARLAGVEARWRGFCSRRQKNDVVFLPTEIWQLGGS